MSNTPINHQIQQIVDELNEAHQYAEENYLCAPDPASIAYKDALQYAIEIVQKVIAGN